MKSKSPTKATNQPPHKDVRLRIVDDFVNAPRMEIIKDEDPLNIYGIPQSEMTPLVRQAVEAMHKDIIALKTERTRLKSELRDALALADTDPLTGILNRRGFEREIARAISFARRMNVECTLLFFDLNGFKQINDNYGHDAGDLVIKEFAKKIHANLRQSDVVGRVGGDEFMALLVKANKEEATHKAAQFNEVIKNIAIPYKNTTIGVKCTIGVHTVKHDENIKQAITSADKAMYANKLSDKIASL
jgi:diguanylate cyclase (GGDEF)-like protein